MVSRRENKVRNQKPFHKAGTFAKPSWAAVPVVLTYDPRSICVTLSSKQSFPLENQCNGVGLTPRQPISQSMENLSLQDPQQVGGPNHMQPPLGGPPQLPPQV